jgi:hypothetical protein
MALFYIANQTGTNYRRISKFSVDKNLDIHCCRICSPCSSGLCTNIAQQFAKPDQNN